MKRKSLPLWTLGLLTFAFLFGAAWLATSGPAHAQGGSTPALEPSSVEPSAPSATTASGGISLWEPLTSNRYSTIEKVLLLANVGVALAGLLYAFMLVGQVKSADQGTPRMQEIAHAVREGANAYLFRQFRVVGVLIVLITVALYFAAKSSGAATGNFFGSRDRVSRRFDVLGHGRFRRHAVGHDRQLARGGGRSGQALARLCSWAIAPARSPAC